MCGICGYVFSDAVRPGAPRRHRAHGRRARAPRPRRRRHLRRAGRAALGHRRLAIIDLSPAGHQPMANEDGRSGSSSTARSTTTASCAPASRRARPRLPHRAATPRSSSTSTRSGARPASSGCAACSPSRSGTARRRRLFSARDRVGKKPLYYAHAPGGDLVFASEIKALARRAPRVRPRRRRDRARPLPDLPVRARAAHDLRGASTSCRPRTSSCWQGGQRCGCERYWRLRYVPKLRRGRRRRVRGALRAQLARGGARCASISDVPLGAFLSGGIDSSAVVALMAAGVAPRRCGPSRSASPRRDFDELRLRARGRRALRHRAPRSSSSSPDALERPAASSSATSTSRSPTPRRSRPTTSRSWPASTSRWRSPATAATRSSPATSATSPSVAPSLSGVAGRAAGAA